MISNKKYEKIIVLGAGGSGKTTLAKKLSKKSGIKVYHLDKEYWLPNWQRPDNEQWKSKIEKLAKQDSWIMDGNYIDTLDIRLSNADLVIMLDIKTSICVKSIFFRTIKGFFVKRVDLGSGCNEQFNQAYYEFIDWVKVFKKDYFPKLIDVCIKYPHIDLKIFRTRRSARKFVERMIDDDNEKI